MIEQSPAILTCDGCGERSATFECDDDDIELEDGEEDNQMPIEWVRLTMVRKVINPAYTARPEAVAELTETLIRDMGIPEAQRKLAEVQAEAAVAQEPMYIQVEDEGHLCPKCRYYLGEIGIEVEAYQKEKGA